MGRWGKRLPNPPCPCPRAALSPSTNRQTAFRHFSSAWNLVERPPALGGYVKSALFSCRAGKRAKWRQQPATNGGWAGVPGCPGEPAHASRPSWGVVKQLHRKPGRRPGLLVHNITRRRRPAPAGEGGCSTLASTTWNATTRSRQTLLATIDNTAAPRRRRARRSLVFPSRSDPRAGSRNSIAADRPWGHHQPRGHHRDTNFASLRSRARVSRLLGGGCSPHRTSTAPVVAERTLSAPAKETAET